MINLVEYNLFTIEEITFPPLCFLSASQWNAGGRWTAKRDETACEETVEMAVLFLLSSLIMPPKPSVGNVEYCALA